MTNEYNFNEMVEKVTSDVKKILGGVNEYDKVEKFTLDETMNITVDVLNLMSDSVIKKEVSITTEDE